MRQMKQIEVKVLNPEVVTNAEQMMVAMARLTQCGHKLTNMSDFEELLAQPYKHTTVESMVDLPHPTIQKFGVINVAIVGASRRFLAQITRHQNEVKFMSSSLQYSDYTDKAQFVVPYELTSYDITSGGNLTSIYLNQCMDDLEEYEMLAKLVGKDAAGYKMPQGMRNVLVISATPYQFKHMISQRTCNRNTLETQYVMGLVWKKLWPLSYMFHDCGPHCANGTCPEGKMCCGDPYNAVVTPTELLERNFSFIRR